MPETSFQRFPKDVEKQNCWIKNMRVNRTLSRPTKLFWKNRERWFHYTKNSHTRRRLLLREAAPLIFPQLLTHLRNKKSLNRLHRNTRDLVPLQNFKTESETNLTIDNENTVSSCFSEEQKSTSVVHREPSTSSLKSFCVKPVDKYQVFVIKQSTSESLNTTQELITNQNATNTTEKQLPKSSSIDEYEALGISWVAQLRKLKESQKVLAAGLISQVLQKGYFEDLTKNTRINDTLTSDSLLNSPPTTISFPSSLSSYCIGEESNSNEVVIENNTTEEEITMNTEVVFVDSPERVFITCSKEGLYKQTMLNVVKEEVEVDK